MNFNSQIATTREQSEQLLALGLKPTEGKLSHYSIRIDNFKPSKSIAWNVAKEWLNEENVDCILKICEAMEANNEEGIRRRGEWVI